MIAPSPRRDHRVPCPALLARTLAALLAACSPPGCASPRPAGPYASPSEGNRDPAEAQALTVEAAQFIESNPTRAEELLRAALTADLYHGPAHNNLGVVHLARGDLYAAAAEFEWARKLMPGQPDPRLNLALALDRAGQTDNAIAAARAALEAAPGHVPSLVTLASLQLRHGRTDEHTPGLLAQIAASSDKEQWRSWAIQQRLRLVAAADGAHPQ